MSPRGRKGRVEKGRLHQVEKGGGGEVAERGGPSRRRRHESAEGKLTIRAGWGLSRGSTVTVTITAVTINLTVF